MISMTATEPEILHCSSLYDPVKESGHRLFSIVQSSIQPHFVRLRRSIGPTPFSGPTVRERNLAAEELDKRLNGHGFA
jgi:hypothetical protein